MSHIKPGWFENAAMNSYDLPTCTTVNPQCIFHLFYLQEKGAGRQGLGQTSLKVLG